MHIWFQVTSDKAQVPSHIALTRTHMHIFHIIEKEVINLLLLKMVNFLNVQHLF